MENEFNKITSPQELLQYMNKHIYYGIVGCNNKVYVPNDKDFQRACNEEWYFRNGLDVLLSCVGHCWDQVEIERYWFTKNNYDFKTLFVFLIMKLILHTVVTLI